MSDDDDLGGFSATTPLVSRKLPPSTSAAGPSRVVNRGRVANTPVSIPSDDEDIQPVPKVRGKRGTGATSSTGTGKRRQTEDDDPVDGERDTRKRRNRKDEDESDDEVQEVPPTAAKRTRANSRKPTSRANVNGTARGVKGKRKAKPKVPEITDVDEVESVDIEQEDARIEVERLASVINASLTPTKRANTRTKVASGIADNGASDECAKLREQLRQGHGHIEDLKRKMEELHQVRMTEPEQLLGRMIAQHQKEQQGSEALIRDLREQLARKDPFLRSNKTSGFELLTREEANKETQNLRNQLNDYQDVVRERDQIVKEKDEEIGELKNAVNDLRYELHVEIERAKNLSQKQPDSASRTRRGRVLSQNEDPKMAEVVRFYEDLTNLLVTDIKPQPARHLQLEDWLLRCVYSHREAVDKGSPSARSLSFRLRQCHEPKSDLLGEPKSKNDLVESLQYTPLELENETEAFVKSLGFLKDPFTFERDQLALFLRTLHDVVSGDGNGNDSGGSEDGIQVIG